MIQLDAYPGPNLIKLLRWLPASLILAFTAFCPGAPWTHLEAQNIEGQIVASQFGEYQVPTVGNGFSFLRIHARLMGATETSLRSRRVSQSRSWTRILHTPKWSRQWQ